MLHWKGFGRKSSWHNLIYCPCILLEGLQRFMSCLYDTKQKFNLPLLLSLVFHTKHHIKSCSQFEDRSAYISRFTLIGANFAYTSEVVESLKLRGNRVSRLGHPQRCELLIELYKKSNWSRNYWGGGDTGRQTMMIKYASTS
jgi:hypothetical protein